MNRSKRHLVVAACVGVLILLIAAAPLAGQIRPAARYEGRWEIHPNGEVKVTRLFKLPMQLYRMWKQADVHMLEFRNLEAGRSNVEVADKKAEWDDVNRTLTLKMTVLGLARNMATHWEARMVPGLEFSNLDDVKKIAYFHFAVDGSLGRVQGQDIVHLPPTCSQPAWDAPSRTIRYVLPTPATAEESEGSSGTLWWVLFGLSALVAAGAWAASFAIRFGGETPDATS